MRLFHTRGGLPPIDWEPERGSLAEEVLAHGDALFDATLTGEGLRHLERLPLGEIGPGLPTGRLVEAVCLLLGTLDRMDGPDFPAAGPGEVDAAFSLSLRIGGETRALLCLPPRGLLAFVTVPEISPEERARLSGMGFLAVAATSLPDGVPVEAAARATEGMIYTGPRFTDMLERILEEW